VRPKWENKKAVFKLVEERLKEQAGAYHDFIWAGRPHHLTEAQLQVADPNWKEIIGPQKKWDEQSAVEEAKRGNLKPLAYHILMPDVTPEYDADENITKAIYEVNDQIAHLKPETWFLIIEFLLGDRSLKTGRKRGELGAPKMSEEEKRKSKRWGDIIGARDLYEAVIDTLRGEFPEQRTKEIRDRALEFAADKTGVTETTLLEHVKKHRRRRRDLPSA
jgi:hypothetical protein